MPADTFMPENAGIVNKSGGDDVGKYPIRPISAAEFEFAVGLMNAAAGNRMHVTNPETVAFCTKNDGCIKEYRFKDHPLTRGMLALQDNLDPSLAWPAAMRFWLLSQCANYPSINAHVDRDNSHISFSSYLVAAVATVPWPNSRPPEAADILNHLDGLQSANDGRRA
jgi:hypothetical protein